MDSHILASLHFIHMHSELSLTSSLVFDSTYHLSSFPFPYPSLSPSLLSRRQYILKNYLCTRRWPWTSCVASSWTPSPSFSIHQMPGLQMCTIMSILDSSLSTPFSRYHSSTCCLPLTLPMSVYWVFFLVSLVTMFISHLTANLELDLIHISILISCNSTLNIVDAFQVFKNMIMNPGYDGCSIMCWVNEWKAQRNPWLYSTILASVPIDVWE